jgi:oleandomycin transport system permease protein
MKKRFSLRHALVLCKRNLIKLTRTPEQLIDVTLQPIIFLVLFLYVFGGAISHGSQHDYLQFLPPGLIGRCRSAARCRWWGRCSPTSSGTCCCA